MIRRLEKNDHEQCMELLRPKAAENLFILGDIEAYGYDQDFQKLWGDFDEKGNLRAVLLKFYKNYIPYAADANFDHKGLASVISKDPEFRNLNGLKKVASLLMPWIRRKQIESRELYYTKCDRLQEITPRWQAKMAGVQDIDRLMDLYRQVPSFGDINPVAKRIDMENGVTRTYYIEIDGQMVSTASTAAENMISAMIVGVCTLEAYREKGMASDCLYQLCRDVMAEGKKLCLFYDNPDAGRIYERMGFKCIDKWLMVSFA